MRWQVLVAALVVASPAAARPHAAGAPHPDFWREVIEPNGVEVAEILEKANRVLQAADMAATGDQDFAVDQRMRFYRDAYHLLRYARKLSPENVAVLAKLGRTADEIGKTAEAIEALEAAVRVTGPDKAGPAVTGKLGAIYLRLDKLDAAIRWLRYAQGDLGPETAPALLHLANALAARGETAAAIDTLSNAIPTKLVGTFEGPLALVGFGLAVLYDRDEQRAAAFDVLDHMQTATQGEFAKNVHTELARVRFAPAADRHYYQALLYEVQGFYVEARAEWALYAASGDLPWRGRALDHIAAIDTGRRAGPPKPPAAGTLAPPIVHRRIPRP